MTDARETRQQPGRKSQDTNPKTEAEGYANNSNTSKIDGKSVRLVWKHGLPAMTREMLRTTCSVLYVVLASLAL